MGIKKCEIHFAIKKKLLAEKKETKSLKFNGKCSSQSTDQSDCQVGIIVRKGIQKR